MSEHAQAAVPNSIYLCPICHLPMRIHQASQGLHCPKKHHLDPHANGYFIFSQAKKPHSDSRQVMRAKRFLLESGVFAPLVDTMAKLINQAELPQGPLNYLDYDCSEGYYLRSLQSKLATLQPKLVERFASYGISEAENSLFAAAKVQKEAKAEAEAENQEAPTQPQHTPFDNTLLVSMLNACPLPMTALISSLWWINH